ncbi:MAG: hypothetical protein WDN48_13650 [Pseudolabrys sp.]
MLAISVIRSTLGTSSTDASGAVRRALRAVVVLEIPTMRTPGRLTSSMV